MWLRAVRWGDVMRKTALFLVLVGLSLASPASATPYMATSGEADAKPKFRKNELHIGMLAGGVDIGDVNGGGIGLGINAGLRFGDLMLLGQFDYLSVGESEYMNADARRGSQTRLGLAARYSVLDTGHSRHNPLGVNFWLEAGGGRQRVSWNGGGTLTRNDMVLGFGLQLNIKLKRNGKPPRYLGPFFAFRTNIARAPEAGDSIATCQGPCDTATGPSRNDLSFFGNFGLHWGG